MTPQARHEKLVVQEIGDETVIYDEQRNHVHRLNQTAAIVWQHCNGQNTVTTLTDILQNATGTPVTEEVVWLALDRLEKEHLLASKLNRPSEAKTITRRQMLKKVALVGGMTLLLPVVQSIVAPTPAMAMSISCRKRGFAYDYPTNPCCPGLIPISGKCRDRTGQI
jgi:hypothetical protein